jgi:CDP-diacylglycerol--glycerol-3-phosphate 3-phosphatidyltransferase
MSFFSLLEMRGTYAWKPAFQRLLLPFVRFLARAGVRANQVTCTACALSILTGVFLLLTANQRWFLLLPAVLLVRMALNAVDGMLARQFGQSSRLGVYLNELGDVISDVFLYLPFAHLPGFRPFWVWSVVVLAVSSEMAGALGVMAGSNRRYDGPMGKSDRALVFGALGLLAGLTSQLPRQIGYITPKVMALLVALTIINRVRAGLDEGETEHAAL